MTEPTPRHHFPKARVRWKRSDFSVAFGVLVALVIIVFAVVMGGNVRGFFDVHSICLVIGGTLAVSVACFSFLDVVQVYKIVGRTIFDRSHDLKQTALRALEISDLANKKGILDLENHYGLVKHHWFFHDGVEMLVDGANKESIERALSYEMHAMQERFSKAVEVLKKSAEVAPAMGLIGTLIGLVQMMSSLDDPSRIGPAMSIALLTTFYGTVTSYLVFTPLATKIERFSQNELSIVEIYFHAICSIAKRETPRQLEVVLNSVLPPVNRIYVFNARERDEPGM